MSSDTWWMALASGDGVKHADPQSAGVCRYYLEPHASEQFCYWRADSSELWPSASLRDPAESSCQSSDRGTHKSLQIHRKRKALETLTIDHAAPLTCSNSSQSSRAEEPRSTSDKSGPCFAVDGSSAFCLRDVSVKTAHRNCRAALWRRGSTDFSCTHTDNVSAEDTQFSCHKCQEKSKFTSIFRHDSSHFPAAPSV